MGNAKLKVIHHKYYKHFSRNVSKSHESIFCWNSIAQKTNEIFDKILAYEARAEFCQIFCLFFGQWSFKEKWFWDLLTFILAQKSRL